MVKCSENPVNAINKKEVTKDFLIYTMGASSRRVAVSIFNILNK